jgi:hypothetical protein
MGFGHEVGVPAMRLVLLSGRGNEQCVFTFVMHISLDICAVVSLKRYLKKPLPQL